jgi:DNA topoisomerase-3
MIVERDGMIERFVAQPYCEIEATFCLANGGRYVGKLVRREAVDSILGVKAQDAGESAGSAFRFPADVKIDPVWQRSGAIVERVEEEQHREGSPLLYDLTELQRHANRVFGISAQHTVDAAQSLYEKKLLTYPRTDSRYVPGDVAATLPAVAGGLEGHYKELVTGSCAGALPSRFVNDAKVTDHHAILPTTRRPERRELTDNEARIYDLVCRRLLSCWLRDYISAVTTVLTWTAASAGKDLWVSKGTVVVQEGWKVLDFAVRTKEPETEPDKNGALPAGLSRGVQSQVESVEVRKKKTRPPARFTEASLLTAMESAGRTIEEAELSEAMRERGLGTPATRAATIELLVARGYVERGGKKQLHSTQLGRDVIAAVAPELRSAELTGRWEANLKGIERGLGSVDRFMGSIVGFVGAVVDSVKARGVSPIRVVAKRNEDGAAPNTERRRGGKKKVRCGK